MAHQLVRQQIQEGVHREVQERIGSDDLKRTRGRGLPDAADAVENDDARCEYGVMYRLSRRPIHRNLVTL